MATDSTNLDRLPFETLQQITGYLDATHRPSLYAFSLASKTCRTATLRSVFRKIHLSIQSREALQSDINSLVTILSITDSARYVRHLYIKGLMIWNSRGSEEPGEDEREQRLLRASNVLEVLGDDEPVVHSTFVQHQPVVVSRDEDMAWARVIDLIKALPHLAELVYDCRNQFPPSLLDALHKNHPQCKLFHLQFRLRSLRWEVPDPHEMAIATSPCLHSVNVNYVSWDSEGEFDYNHEAMLELVAGLAPNLKEVRMLQLIASPTGQSIRRLALVHRQPWRGLSRFVPRRRKTGSLTSLSLAGAMSFEPDFFQAWNNCTDWSSLRHLALGGGIDCYGGVNDKALTWILENRSLVRLKTLRIRLHRDDDATERPNYTDVAVRFFKALEPLDELSVSGSLEPRILDAILSQHGRSLKRLSLRPFESFFPSDGRHIPMVCTKEHVLQIQAQCPALQDLTIPIKRTRSDAREAEMYRSLGKLAPVRNLLLILDCSDWQVARGTRTLTDDPSFDEEDRRFYPRDEDGCRPLRRGYLRESFLNCAVDETLARSIWATICRNKVGARLQSLKVYTTGGGSFGLNSCWLDIQHVVDHLSRSWLIERGVRDDEDWDTIKVRELGRRAREIRDEELSDEQKYIYGEQSVASRHSTADSCSPGSILRRIWPCRDGSKDWHEIWASLPLQA